MIRAFALFAAMACVVTPAEARRQCPQAEVDAFAALIRDSAGNAALLIARVRRRLETEDVECWAKRGDKPMILELGKRFETGDGVDQDIRRAEALFNIAATSSGGPIFVYSPGINGQSGRVIQVSSGPLIPGLPEGTFRRALMHIEGRAHKASPRKGFKMVDRLAQGGYRPAIDYLAKLPRS
ncbi:MAG: sel1 repeat family protein [Sphingomonadaceae bacterium]